MSKYSLTKKTLSPKNRQNTLKGSCLWGILLFFVLIAVDLVTKMLAEVYFTSPGAKGHIDIIPGWISLTLTYNRGIAYGMGDGSPTGLKLLVIGVTFAMMLVFAVLYFKLDKRRSFLRIALVLVVAGGIGNFIDRVYFRVWDPNTLLGVRDMVDLSRFGFAVCNFADFFITGGAVMLALSILFFDKDALFPLTKKYKALAKERAEEEKAKEQAKTSERE